MTGTCGAMNYSNERSGPADAAVGIRTERRMVGSLHFTLGRSFTS